MKYVNWKQVEKEGQSERAKQAGNMSRRHKVSKKNERSKKGMRGTSKEDKKSTAASCAGSADERVTTLQYDAQGRYPVSVTVASGNGARISAMPIPARGTPALAKPNTGTIRYALHGASECSMVSTIV